MADLFFNSCHSLPLPDTDLNIVEFMNHFPGMNLPGQQEAAFCCQGLTSFHHDNISPQFSECCSGNLENFHGDFAHLGKATVSYFDEPVVSIGSDNRDRKRKGIKTDPGTPESSSVHSSPRVKANLQGRGKKGKAHAKVDDKESKEVIHVRARRGQATDSHSLAERVRRGKINERIHLLKDIVPGCYKNMGMAVMLDETINYVQSLQNQVEFLSMKITAASTYNDFNCEEDAFNPMQGIPCSQFPSPDINSGYSQQFPHS